MSAKTIFKLPFIVKSDLLICEWTLINMKMLVVFQTYRGSWELGNRKIYYQESFSFLHIVIFHALVPPFPRGASEIPRWPSNHITLQKMSINLTCCFPN